MWSDEPPDEQCGSCFPRMPDEQIDIMTSEQEDNFRLRKAEEFLNHSRESEQRARVTLAESMEQTKRAKEKYETLFMECEKRAVARRINTLST